MQSEPIHQQAVTASEQFGPVRQQERVALLDVLRGFAVLGILLVNHDIGKLWTDALFPSAADRIGHTLVYVLGLSKFWPLFALLFGVGFAVQLERADARKTNIIPTYIRRLFFLAVIGCVLHLVLDVPQLLWLSIAGVPMLVIGYALRRRQPAWLLVAAAAVLMLDWGVSIPRTFARDTDMAGVPEVAEEEVASRIEGLRANWKNDVERDVSWSLDRVGPRVQQMLRYYVGVPRYLVRGRGLAIYGLLEFMLLGVFLWRIRVLQDAARHRRLFICVLSVSLPIGLAAAIFTNSVEHAWAVTRFGLGEYPTQLTRLILSPMHTVGSLGMVLTYVAGIALLMQRTVWVRMLGLFAPVGRVALTNYALQALLPALAFGAYTPGVPQISLGVWMNIVVLLLLFGLQIIFSRTWLRSCRFGPLEWVLRSLTYWRLQPMRRPRGA